MQGTAAFGKVISKRKSEEVQSPAAEALVYIAYFLLPIAYCLLPDA